MSQLSERIDPESRAPLSALLQNFPGGLTASWFPDNIVAGRVSHTLRVKSQQASMPPNDRVTFEDRLIPGPAGAPEVSIRIYRPFNAKDAVLPGIFTIHSGGFISGSIQIDHIHVCTLSELVGAVVVAVDYRLAPEHPFPAGIEDCYSVLEWFFSHAEELGVDSKRIALHGVSAGGGLTLGLALMARDRKGPQVCFQMPLYSMIDDTNTTPSAHEVVDVGVWDRSTNIQAWKWYLGSSYGTDSVSEYAAPSRAKDWSGLPPTYIDVGTVDLFRDENMQIADRICKAGVPVEFHLYPGAYHASEYFAPQAELSRRIMSSRMLAFKRALFPTGRA